VKAYAGDAMIEFRTDRYYVKLTARRDPAGWQTLLRDFAAAVAEAAATASPVNGETDEAKIPTIPLEFCPEDIDRIRSCPSP
jgi:hypothetical protein